MSTVKGAISAQASMATGTGPVGTVPSAQATGTGPSTQASMVTGTGPVGTVPVASMVTGTGPVGTVPVASMPVMAALRELTTLVTKQLSGDCVVNRGGYCTAHNKQDCLAPKIKKLISTLGIG